MVVDRHTLAMINIIGSFLDVLGGLYLAYDILGGAHGPLRTLSRAVTYGVLFGAGYGAAFGLVFGVLAGITHGMTLAWEFARESRDREQAHAARPSIWYDSAMSAIRGTGHGAGGAYLYGGVFGVTLGLMSTVGQVIAYRAAGIRPAMVYSPSKKPRTNKRALLAVLNRTVGYTLGAALAAVLAGRQDYVALGLKFGLVIGAVTAVSTTFAPVIEWYADRMPQRRMGVIGVALILCGFSMQSIQYWLTMLDVAVK